MLRRIITLLICLVVLIPACRKKTEPEQKQKPLQKQEPTVKAPPGMTVIQGVENGPVFMRNEPVTVAEYQEFLTTIGRPVPEQRSGDNATLQKPVTGLTLEQANEYATWQLASVPTANEWRNATTIVGNRPYPWGPDADPDAPRPNAELYIVQRYLPNSRGEEVATQEKKDLREKILSKRVDEIVTLQETLDGQLKELQGQWKSLWQEMKPAFFESLKTTNRAARIKAEQEGQNTGLRILQEVATEKVKQINLKVNKASSEKMEQAAQAYRAFLKENLQMVQQKLEGLKDTRAELDEQTLEMKQKLEKAGENWVQNSVDDVVGMREGASRAGGTLSEALQAKDLLQRALDMLEQKAPDMDKMSQLVNSIRQSAEEAEKEAQRLAANAEAADEIASLKEKLDNLSQHLDKDFPGEQELIKALEELVDRSAKVKALRAEVEELTSMAERIGNESGQQGE